MTEFVRELFEEDEPKYFLLPVLASDPLPFICDAEGTIVNADGEVASLEERREMPVLRACGIAPEHIESGQLPKSDLY